MAGRDTRTPGRPADPKKQLGQAATEFAISSIMLLLLVSGIVDLGRAFYYNVSMHGAAREGARHAAWFDPGSYSNPYLDDVDVLCAVNENLAGSSYKAVLYGGGQPPCPPDFPRPTGYVYPGATTVCPATGNQYNNPPIPTSLIPASANQPVLFVCYKTATGGYGGARSTPPADNSYAQGDVEVIIETSMGIVTPLLQNVFGSGIAMVAYAHINVQGSPP